MKFQLSPAHNNRTMDWKAENSVQNSALLSRFENKDSPLKAVRYIRPGS